MRWPLNFSLPHNMHWSWSLLGSGTFRSQTLDETSALADTLTAALWEILKQLTWLSSLDFRSTDNKVCVVLSH